MRPHYAVRQASARPLWLEEEIEKEKEKAAAGVMGAPKGEAREDPGAKRKEHAADE